MRALRPDVDLLGMGGPEMEAAGVRLEKQKFLITEDALAERQLEIMKRRRDLERDIRAAMGRLENALEAERPDLLVPIDFPDFNLRLARRARARRVPVVYFVSPQVWAWRRGRVRVLRRLVRRMLVLFPFERAFYEEAGVPVTFVGHPVVERVDPGVRRPDLLVRAGLDPGRGGAVARKPPQRGRPAAPTDDRGGATALGPTAGSAVPRSAGVDAARRGPGRSAP